ncbi:MAG: peptide chain release factor 1 [Planctomycetota bacterium]|nr:peptide chain release factor 1 [Planctomycetota bacterium]MEC8653364.1 peptide chain release factor 1 [Planctomycetota bacterium]MEC9047933.1 peptide chain release factor 1 [Planctomycetota bacterium]
MTGLHPKVRARLDRMVARANELMAQSSSPEFADKPEQLSAIHRELGEATPVVQRYQDYQKKAQELEDNRALVGGEDKELAELARMEIPELEEQLTSESAQLLDLMLAEVGDDRRNCIVEIRAGTGGDEAALFVRDLLTLYQRYGSRMGWTIEPMNSVPTETGGFKEATIGIKGKNVFHAMQFESGGHRVQRVPETEAKGRVHTSAATVAVLPEVEEVDVHIDAGDLRIDTYRASGAGGQHVNKTDSAVRITHLPTGTVVACQDERSQIKNRSKAMTLLRSRIYEAEQRRVAAERAAERKEQVGTGDRSDRVRTYNFPQDRLTDHRLGKNFALAQVMEGKLEPIIGALQLNLREQRIAAL